MMLSLFRRKRLVRPVSAGLAAVLLALSISAGFHSGDHDDLGWLPSRFHHHDYQWGVEPAGAPLPLVDHCHACHIGRTLVRVANPAIALPATSTLAVASASGAADAAPSRAAFPHTSRAPPSS